MFKSQVPTSLPAHLTWSRVKIPPLVPIRGWLAGPMIGVHVHWLDSSKPCRKLITDGLLPCAICSPANVAKWYGYIPYWDEHLVRSVVIISPTAREAVERIGVFEPILIRKGAQQTDTIRVTLVRETNAKPLPAVATALGEQDIKPWLMHLWGDVELTAFFGCELRVAPPITPVQSPPQTSTQTAEEKERLEAAMSKLRQQVKDRLIGTDERIEPESPATSPANPETPPVEKRTRTRRASPASRNGAASSKKPSLKNRRSEG